MFKLRTCQLRGFTLVELLVVITIIGILIALLLPAVQAAREAARQLQCLNGQKQVALAMHHYHEAKGCFPYGQKYPVQVGIDPPDKLCWFHELLPYLEQEALYEAVMAQSELPAGTTHNGLWWTPGRWIPTPSCWCPSDPDSPKITTAGWSESPGSDPEQSQGFSGNVVACAGSTVFNPTTSPTGDNLNGMFYYGSQTRMADVQDGTSHTLMLGEIIVVHDLEGGIAHTGGDTGGQKHDIRGRYYNSMQGYSWFSTKYPPNTSVGDRHTWCIHTPPHAPCQSNGTDNVIQSLRSYHPGGVNVAFADGSGRLISDHVNAAVFQALGTRAGGETISANAY